MNRYSVIDSKLQREFVLLQGTGCRWKQNPKAEVLLENTDLGVGD